MKIQKYADIRDQLQTGDKLLCAGVNLVSRRIEAITDSPYSHIAGVWVTHGRVMEFEAISQGATLRPLSLMAHEGYKYISVHRIGAAFTPQFNGDKYVTAMLDLLGKEYGYSTINKIWWKERLKIPAVMVDDPGITSVICSQYQSLGDQAAGIDPSDKPAQLTYPSDFMEGRCKYYGEVFRFKF
ncbi:MAG: hypothetical protein HZB29_09755 [Nitrospinae bacterium]|nr:hypothetical protein [Nitrospinota bacterium]